MTADPFGALHALGIAFSLALQNNADAQYRLGACYANGTGVERDRAEALKWIRLSATQGDELTVETLRQIDGWQAGTPK